MILFTILFIIVAIIASLAILTVGTVGAAGIIVFAEPILCVVLIVFMVKLLRRKKK